MPPEIAAAIHADYLRLRSCAKVAALWGRARQSIHDVLQRRKKTRPRRLREDDAVIWRGEKFTPGKHGYLRRCRRRGHAEQMLHRVIWEDAQGPIPEDHRVRFKDGDNRNFDLGNLECLPLAECSARTATGENGATKSRRWDLALSMESFIIREANQYAAKFGVEAADLRQAGLLEAARAAGYFDPSRGRFFGFAYLGIKGAMRREAIRLARPVTISERKFFELPHTVRLDAPVSGEAGDERTWADTIPAPAATDAASQIDTEAAAAALHAAMRRLRPRQREVVRQIFFDGKTEAELAAERGVSRQAVSIAKLKALEALKNIPSLKRFAA